MKEIDPFDCYCGRLRLPVGWYFNTDSTTTIRMYKHAPEPGCFCTSVSNTCRILLLMASNIINSFSACWTVLTAGTYTLLFLHPTWSKHPASSIGAQAIWIFLSWLFWIVGSGILNSAVPSLLVKGSCSGVVYCGQIRALFGMYPLSSSPSIELPH